MFNLKRYFLLDPSVTFLNHGSFGATPKPVFKEYQRWQRELEIQPVEFLGRRHNDLMRASRAALGKYLGTSAENLVYAQNATIALNIVAHSLELGAGDEVLSTDHEYGALDRTWHFLSKERGFTYINRPVDLTSQAALIESFWQGVTAHTRVVFLSHITSPTATIFPVEKIIQRARAKGIITIIDGAHVPGQLPLHLDTLGADFYGGNLHNFRCPVYLRISLWVLIDLYLNFECCQMPSLWGNNLYFTYPTFLGLLSSRRHLVLVSLISKTLFNDGWLNNKMVV